MNLRRLTRTILLPVLSSLFIVSAGQADERTESEIPGVYSRLSRADGDLIFTDSTGEVYPETEAQGPYTLDQLRANLTTTGDTLKFDFGNDEISGTLYYGLIHSPTEVRHAYPVFYSGVKIESGQAVIPVKTALDGKYDFTNWEKSGRLRLGYRIVSEEGTILYDGKILLQGTGPLAVDTSIVEGPFVNMITPTGAIISFETNFPCMAGVTVDGKTISEDAPGRHHEIQLSGLAPDSTFPYSVNYGGNSDTYSLRTAPHPGSRLPFTFAYASDARGNNGGGERDIWGTNAYMMKRIGVLATQRQVRFLQFTGDLIDGFTTGIGEINLEYANFKRGIEPYAHYLPFIIGCGNHENVFYQFTNGDSRARVDRFPFATESSEAVFAANFVNPRNGPESEDGSRSDPDSVTMDFPPYDETVFYYIYDNVAMVVLNTNYWYAPSRLRGQTGGNIVGYIMDRQLEWLGATLARLESDNNIDHVFVTLHHPVFPNGGHVRGAMWYRGNNDPRPSIAGQPVEKGIIERRDQLLDLLLNRSSKVAAVLTGDEHNYCRLRIDSDMVIYPDDYPRARLQITRPLWQINNGAAGAPYYGQESAPWSDHVRKFSTQNALVLFHVAGDAINVEVINPDTMEQIDAFTL